MTDKKLIGSYYTPDFLSKFIINHIAGHFTEDSELSILEPSIGDGSFVKGFNETIFPSNILRYKLTGIDIIQSELLKANNLALLNKKADTEYKFVEDDFLNFQKDLCLRYNLIIGNPPYISKSFLTEAQISLCNEIHESASLSKNSIKNIWSAFLIRSALLLTNSGVLAFVLPAELLQVKFSQELRSFLKTQFERIEIFTFSELLFDCKGQDTIILIAYKQHGEKGQFYTHISDKSQLDNNNFVLTPNKVLAETNTKWSHHLFPADDLQFVKNLGNKLEKVNLFCDSKPGIVSAANRFFIVNEETEKYYKLGSFTQSIIQKGLFVNGSVVFQTKDYVDLVAAGKPTRLLVFIDGETEHLSLETKSYLELGVLQELPKRYKCLKRKNWFVIPNISTIPQGFFFKRSHHYPKLLKNDANVLVTDSAYKIQMKGDYQINHLIYSFYNSLTLLFAEMDGRYYGGGVLELTPSEFKNLPVPYISISDEKFGEFADRFKNKEDIASLLKANDSMILNKSLGLSNEEIERIHSIYNKFVIKRLRE